MISSGKRRPSGPQEFYLYGWRLTCNSRDRVQGSEKVQAGEVDMDVLCAQLKAKARCNGSTAVIDTKDVDELLGPEPTSKKDFMKMFSWSMMPCK